MKNRQIADLFTHTADVLAVQGENTFRVNALRKVARLLEETPQDIAALAASDALDTLPGIGESSAARIREYLRTGHIAEFQDTWNQVPSGVMDMLKIPTLGPKTAALLWTEGGVTSIDDLKTKIDAGSLTTIPGIGAKKLEKIKQNIAYMAAASGRFRLGQATQIALPLVQAIKQLPGVLDAQYCGSLRRAKDTVGDIDIAVSAESSYGQAIADAVTSHPLTDQVIGSGPTKTSIRTTAGIQVDVRVVPPQSFGAALQYFTGSKEHNVHLRELAIKKGLKLNEWGLFKADTMIAGQTEQDIYTALALATLPPEMRENKGEIELAQQLFQPHPPSPTPYTPLQISDIQGELHMHTTASDGHRSIEEMVAECKRRGYHYMAITDHSKSSIQANGLRVDRLLEHIQAIHAVAKEAKNILVLAGSEVDILADGSLDYEDEILAKLGWVVASPHSALTQESDAATARLVRACSNPYVHLIGHPTGRLILERHGLEPDMAKVIFAAARHGVALELNANDHRLDLRDIHLKMAKDAHVPICINTDAHDLPDFDQLQYGILTARRGWLQKPDVLNALPLEAFKKWLKTRKQSAAW